jgi:Right handed beta helix region
LPGTRSAFARAASVWTLLSLVFVASSAAALQIRAVQAAHPSGCDLFASPKVRGWRRLGQALGSRANPFTTAQAMIDALLPGQTGCLRGGTYELHGELRFSSSGSPGAPITLEGYPGETSRLEGGPIDVPSGSNDVTITHLHIDTTGIDQVGVQIMSADDQLTHDNITNHNTRGSCVILGSDLGFGQATNTLVADDTIHQCGYDPGDPFEDHGVYDDNTVDATIADNIFWGMPYGWGVQLYPHAQGTQVTHNVINNRGQGIVIGGNSTYTSSDDVVAYNVISTTFAGYALRSWWGGVVGAGNLAERNCLYSPHARVIERPTLGYSAVGNVIAKPRYADPAKNDYVLSPRSRCRSVVGDEP